jgi:hypothetical protein
VGWTLRDINEPLPERGRLGSEFCPSDMQPKRQPSLQGHPTGTSIPFEMTPAWPISPIVVYLARIGTTKRHSQHWIADTLMCDSAHAAMPLMGLPEARRSSTDIIRVSWRAMSIMSRLQGITAGFGRAPTLHFLPRIHQRHCHATRDQTIQHRTTSFIADHQDGSIQQRLQSYLSHAKPVGRRHV